MCWLKGVLLVFAVASTFLAGIAGAVFVLFGLCNLGDAVGRMLPDGGFVQKVGRVFVVGAFSLLVIALLIGFTVAAQKNVCERGFVGAYKTAWAVAFGK